MPVSGRGKRSILFVAEALGKTEDEQGKQLVGDSGQTLRKILEGIDVNLDDCWITNSVICRPPMNEIQDIHIESCRPNLLNTIEELKPKVVILLGESAVKSLISTEWGDDLGPIGKWVGWNIPSQKYKTWICPSYHPSYVLRSDGDLCLTKIVQNHLMHAVACEAVPLPDYDLTRLSNGIDLITDLDASVRRLRKLAERSGDLAWDYETTGLKPERKEQQIVCVSFSLDGKDNFATPFFMDDAYISALSAVLRNPKLRKIASNMKFEERWTRVKLGHGVAGWKFDTMLASHVLDNRGSIASIKFQTYIRLGIGDYSSSIKPFLKADSPNGLNRIQQVPILEVLKYCGLDSLLEYMVSEIQQEILR